ncbi:related to SGT1-subunit of SCF ubiquitin ligase complex [Sporisorium reilianum SRZ2]|uniref:Related to SGT1-subunit of SCF ubiquitin ligase complex n=1 Tax=Sporisorium reilianum (strain SRZ2) TaxID=999809 RepID=E6ZL13_SPORE|nr:related to SGT1-subunit of SCF ubiquitin ligase complex [Sporisorium reilianum SRZ2]
MADAAASSSSTAAASGPATPRFDFYQTDTVVTVSIFVKGASQDNLQVDIGERSLNVKAVSSSSGSEYVLRIDPLFSTVDVTSSSYKVLSTKIDVILHKAQPGTRWIQLQAGSSQHSVISAATPTYAASQATAAAATAAPRTRSKWDSFNPDADDDTSAAPAAAEQTSGGGADVNKFFQKLYADADDDTRRAMMKSYQESGGTTLSTDWSKVGKERVSTQPPDGMEAKKW